MITSIHEDRFLELYLQNVVKYGISYRFFYKSEALTDDDIPLYVDINVFSSEKFLKFADEEVDMFFIGTDDKDFVDIITTSNSTNNYILVYFRMLRYGYNNGSLEKIFESFLEMPEYLIKFDKFYNESYE